MFRGLSNRQCDQEDELLQALANRHRSIISQNRIEINVIIQLCFGLAFLPSCQLRSGRCDHVVLAEASRSFSLAAILSTIIGYYSGLAAISYTAPYAL